MRYALLLLLITLLLTGIANAALTEKNSDPALIDSLAAVKPYAGNPGRVGYLTNFPNDMEFLFSLRYAVSPALLVENDRAPLILAHWADRPPVLEGYRVIASPYPSVYVLKAE